jgi:hypothetical protein
MGLTIVRLIVEVHGSELAENVGDGARVFLLASGVKT